MDDRMKICVVGLGYVGLPLLIALEKHFEVCGFDINTNRINELNKFNDRNREFSQLQLKSLQNKLFNEISECRTSDIYIITVPTPISTDNKPDLSLIKNAAELVGPILERGNIVVCESTVYPGVTEDYIAPILEHESNLAFNEDFFMGYSPERINPGDNVRTIENIVKVVSGSTPKTLDLLSNIYGAITSAGGVSRGINSRC